MAGVLLTTLLPTAGLLAQTNAIAPARPAARYLIIVETSRAMRGRAQGVFDAVKGLLDSSFQGQLRRGDALGIWTFNEEVNTGWLPFEKWSPDMHLTSALRVARFRQTDAYENRARLENVLPEMNRVIRESGFITLVLLTTGESEMQGTPFDAQINAALKQWHDEQQKANMPLLTLLRAKDGKITDWSVTPAPKALDMPPLITEPQIPQTSTTPPLLTVTRRPKPPAPPPALSQSAAPKTEPHAGPPEPAPVETESAASPPPTKGETSGAPPERTAETALISPPASTPSATEDRAQPTPVLPSEAASVTTAVTKEPLPQITGQPAVPQPQTAPAQVPPRPTVVLAEAPPSQTPPAEKPPPQHEPSRERRPQEKPAMVQTAVTSPPPSPLRENAGLVALLVVAGVAALLCFRMWLLTYLRPSVPIVTLPEPGPENGARASGAAPAPTVPGVSASARATRLPTAEEEFSLGRKPDQ